MSPGHLVILSFLWFCAAAQAAPLITITLNPAATDQTIEGFGAFGGSIHAWQPSLTPALAHRLIDNLGLTVSRGPLPFDFERPDGSFNYSGDVSKWIPIWKTLNASGVHRFIISVWSPPPWMKTPGNHGHTEAWNRDGRAGGTLLPENYDKFAAMCVQFLRYFKSQVGVEVYGLSLQNELAFDEPYESCVYTPAQYVALVKVVGPAMEKAGLTTRLFGPEDIGYRDRVMSYIDALMSDPAARRHIGFVAVHGYAPNGITADSPDARVWQGMYDPVAAQGKQLWMTETSGFGSTWPDAMALSQALYTALRFGHVSGWCWWQAATADAQSPSGETLLAGADGEIAAPKFSVLRQFARLVRPGAVRVDAASTDSGVLPLAFKDAAAHTMTVILINTTAQAQTIRIQVPIAQWHDYRSSATENYTDAGIVIGSSPILLPAQSVTSLLGQIP
jgi:glucuronoarabinoxylan endo-1,4-beta-xylanase